MNFRYKNDSKTVILEEKNHVPYFTFPLLSNTPIVKHGFSTRMGGVSEGIFSSMNLSFVRGDDGACVHENFDRISKAIGIKKENIVCSQQT